MKHVVMMSGGNESYAVAKIVAKAYDAADIVLLFADTKTEDADLYRFIKEAAADVGVPLTTVADGRNIWQVFKDERFLGNSRVDPCSKILKRQILRRWLEENCQPDDATIYIGYRHDEDGRMTKCLHFWSPWTVRFPLHLANVDKCDIVRWMDESGLAPAALYEDGFEHNNCGGGCVKMGIGQAVHLLKTRPDTYAEWEKGEAEMQQFLGKPVTILKDRRGGRARRMSLAVLRERVEAGETDLGRYERTACNYFAG